ncbi:UNKNOWN [Stylonychia lemnae]|uniref:Uncharacterized protein n=1 Tax=Stylonychia lemnae TaxID=5949 RepID=A0A078AJU8_STYLE|nr:UNKNOWN [Stylonychia lemnae]|eukprot:CDW81083.1 UNKNOWN [Stylonychia lemnae]
MLTQRKSIDCKVNKCTNNEEITQDLDKVNECTKTCNKPLMFQQQYAVESYHQFNDDLYAQMSKCITKDKRDDECILKVQKDFAGAKLKEFKSQYEKYLDDLINRKLY